MGERELVDEVRKIVDKIKLEMGPLNLFMLLGDEDGNYNATTYTVVISSKWLDNYSPKIGIRIIVDYLFNDLNKDELSQLTKVTAISTNDQSVREITHNTKQYGGMSWNLGCRFGGLYIKNAIIFESRNIT